MNTDNSTEQPQEVGEKKRRVVVGPSTMRRLKRLAIAAVLILILVAAVWWFTDRGGRHAAVNNLISGFPRNVSLVGHHAGAWSVGGVRPPVFGKRRRGKDLRTERVLSAKEPDDADIEAIVGTNWLDVVNRDTYYRHNLGCDAWRKCIECLLNRKEMSPDKCVKRLRNWTPALYHFAQTRTLDKHFMTRVVKQLEQDGEFVRNLILNNEFQQDFQELSAACALYSASVQLHHLERARKWRREAADSLYRYIQKHQRTDGTIDADVDVTLKAIETIMPVIGVAYRAGISVDDRLARRIQSLMEFPMYYLDMYGCLPFVLPSEYYGTNKREWLYWAAKAFGRKDFAWIAYGGLDMLDSKPPDRISKAFPDAGIYVMRTNWEIRRMNRRKALPPGQPTGDKNRWSHQFKYMSHTLHFDAKRGRFSLFAFGKPQVLVSLPGRNLSISRWQEQDDGIVCQAKLGEGQVQIAQMASANMWIVQIDNVSEDAVIPITPILTKLQWTRDRQGLVTDPQRQVRAWYSLLGLRLKPYGSVCIRTDGNIIEGDTGDFMITSRQGKSRITIVFLAATGEWLMNINAREYADVLPEVAAEARKVAFTEEGCMFEADIWFQGKKWSTGDGKKPRNLLLRLGADDQLPAWDEAETTEPDLNI